MFLLDNAESKLSPGFTVIESEPSLIEILTSPWGWSLDEASKSKLTNINIMVQITKMLAIVVENIIIN